jgi:hypothetical protein
LSIISKSDQIGHLLPLCHAIVKGFIASKCEGELKVKLEARCARDTNIEARKLEDLIGCLTTTTARLLKSHPCLFMSQ